MKQLIEKRTAGGLKIPKYNDLVAIKAKNFGEEIIGRVSSEPRKLDSSVGVVVGYAVQRWKADWKGRRRPVTVLGDYVVPGIYSPEYQIKQIRVIGRMDKDGNVKVLDKRYANRISKTSESYEGEGNQMKQLIERIESLAEVATMPNERAEANIPGKNIQGNARVEGRAKVIGNAVAKDNALVKGTSRVFDNAVVKDNGKVKGNAWVKDNAVVKDRGNVYGQGVVQDNAVVGGRTNVDGMVRDSASVSGGAFVGSSVVVQGRAVVTGDAYLEGRIKVGGRAVITGGRWDARAGEITVGKWKSQEDYLAWKNGR